MPKSTHNFLATLSGCIFFTVVATTPMCASANDGPVTHEASRALSSQLHRSAHGSEGGGGSGGGGGISSGISSKNAMVPTVSTTAIAVASSALEVLAADKAPNTPEVLGAFVFNFTKKLDIGSRGEDVTALQDFLNSIGVYGGPVTGYFGPLTQKAVMLYQTKNNITPAVGLVGPKTLIALNQGQLPVAYKTSEVTAQETANPSYASGQFSKNFGVGASEINVSALQQILADTSLYEGAVTGYFGPATQEALIHFQEANNVPATGFVGPITRAYLNQVEYNATPSLQIASL